MRALAYARATHPDTLEAITVNVDDESTRRLVLEWEKSDLTVPLKVVESPYREITRPVLDYVRRVRRDSPRDVVTVFIPEYVVGHWWEQLLHNQSALRLKSRLLFQPGVMVTSVPWQLRSSADAGAVGRAARTAGSTVGQRGGTAVNRQAHPRTDWSGRRIEVILGNPAHGGACVARFEGRVVFVRHGLPGERVFARVTEDRAGRSASPTWRTCSRRPRTASIESARSPVREGRVAATSRT